MRFLLSTLVALVACGASGCLVHLDGSSWGPAVRGSGLVATAPRAPGEFERIAASGSFRLEVELGEPREVVVEGDDNLLELVETRVEDGELRVRTDRNYSTHLGLTVRVRTPALAALSVGGSHEVELRGLRGERFELSCSGSNELRAEGALDRLELSLSGSSEVDLSQLVAREARVSASGSSELKVHATELLELSLSGSSDVRYAGAPRIELSQSGSSSVARL